MALLTSPEVSRAFRPAWGAACSQQSAPLNHAEPSGRSSVHLARSSRNPHQQQRARGWVKAAHGRFQGDPVLLLQARGAAEARCGAWGSRHLQGPLPALRGPPGSPCRCLRERGSTRRQGYMTSASESGQAAHEEPQAREHVQEEHAPQKFGKIILNSTGLVPYTSRKPAYREKARQQP